MYYKKKSASGDYQFKKSFQIAFDFWGNDAIIYINTAYLQILS